ncbi:inositol monophosphatase family protein [Deinococcus maricopensis]|uniref:Inositol-1-monophosphatase n=1 Tax=Deinococcus maricopensis (strain DSM 21211 / LMG 22137 / NRRL B-23946 / LB-34) TaxID=709986 RepID=E8UAZ9_DEIML|nr:inositol monophosphatase family protein [Deinococcus maricopensis]ADV68238.1 Inositol-phosphate phosphatase [Deinococcus maricopensis DSM 21211]
MSQDQAFLDVAVRAARAAGAVHLAGLGRTHAVQTKTTFSDLVTEVDAEAERVIRDLILQAHPDHAILGEEGGLVGEGADALWVVDPLDGTVNYAHGYPVFCASIALELRGERVAGAVYDPTRDELFTATRGGGAHLNGRPIRVSDTPELRSPALVSTGFPYDVDRDQRNLGLLRKLLAVGVPVRRPGAAALDLCNVACGRMDAYWELGLKRWDSAAGSLIVEEAGGLVTDGAGERTPYAPLIVATNGKLHAELLGVLNG